VRTLTASEMAKQWQSHARWNYIPAALSERGMSSSAGVDQIDHTFWRAWAQSVVVVAAHESYVPALGCPHRHQAVQQVRAGLKAIYLQALAGRSRCQRRQSNVSRPESYPAAASECGAQD